MKNKNKSLYLFILFVFGFLFLNYSFVKSSSNFQINIFPVCGNNIKEAGEQCDGPDLGGATCASQGFVSGVISCTSACILDTSGCSAGTSGGGSSEVITSVVFEGKAYPRSSVMLLKDAQLVASTVAGSDANFQLSISGLTSGNYIFSLYSEDSLGIRSSLLTFPLSVTYGASISVGGIFISPTITSDKKEVKRGENIAIFGQSAPGSDILISVNSEQELFFKTASDQSGAYLYNLDTSILEYGNHGARSRASIDNDLISNWSLLASFKVGLEDVEEDPEICYLRGDLNNDCRVDLVDFSIAAYWYKRDLSESFKVIEKEKLNGDGKIDLIDFSIIAYYWTG